MFYCLTVAYNSIQKFTNMNKRWRSCFLWLALYMHDVGNTVERYFSSFCGSPYSVLVLLNEPKIESSATK